MATDTLDLDFDLQAATVARGDGVLDDMDRIRDNDPVFWSEKAHCWFITKHEDVVDVFQRKYPVTNADRMWFIFHSIPKEEWETRIPALIKYSQLWVTSSEGEQHARLRSLLMKALNRRIIESMRPYARERAEILLDKAIAKDKVEFNEEISRAMTGDVLFTLLGMPKEVFPKLRDWANGLMEGVGSPTPSPAQLERANWALEEMNKVVRAELAKRRTDPKDDLITALANATEDGVAPLTEDEVCAQMHVAIVAGHDTTMNTLTLSVKALGEHPEAWDYMYQHQDKMLDCVTELQRFVGMSGGQPRLVTDDFELRGKKIKKGDMLISMIMAANRDEAVFPDADKLDFTRNNARAMMFAPGVHFCIGHMLAKMQLTEFMTAMVNKAKGVELLDTNYNWAPVWVFRGLYSLNLRFIPR